jgi:hypothetical protein
LGRRFQLKINQGSNAVGQKANSVIKFETRITKGVDFPKIVKFGLENHDNDNSVTCYNYQEVNFNFVISESRQIKINENLLFKYRQRMNQVMSDNKCSSNCNMIELLNSNAIMIQCKDDMKFSSLHLDPSWIYYLDGKVLNDESIVSKGDNLIRIKGRILGGIEFEGDAIYSGMEIKKLDLVGYDENDMEFWIMRAMG